MQDSAVGLDGLQLSAITKASVISRDVTEVTLGPNSKHANCSDVNSKSEGIYELDERNYVPVEDEFFIKSHAPNITASSSMNSGSDSLKSIEREDKSSRCLMKLMYEFNLRRQMGVKDLMNRRFLEMEKDSQIRQLEVQRKYQYLTYEIKAKAHHEEQLVVRQLQEDEILASQRQQQLAQEHRQHAQRMNEWNEKLKEEEKRQKEAEEDQRKRMKEKKIQLDRLHQYQLEYRTKYEEIVEAAKQCKDRQAFVAKVSCHTAKLKSLKEALDQLITRCKTGELSDLDLETASTIIQQLEEILGVIREESQKINEQLDKEAVEANAAKEEQKAQATRSSQSTQALTSNRIFEELNDFVDREAFNVYISLQQHLQNFENSYKNLQKDDRLKKFRFECQKAVNIPVNAISPISADHLQDKLFRLSRLISGQPVEVGHGQVIASSHPEGIAFCKNLLAKKFVCQGELTVSSKPEAAFAIAAVIEALWADFPDFGQLILGHFHRECPYLVPIFMPQVEGQSTEDYYKSLGYHYNESGEVEKQDRFLKRMSGIMRLYSAVLISRPCRYQQNKSHPHGLSQAWRWISCMLNMDPKPDICATLLFDFLEVAGSTMYSHYGQQFQKLLHLICKEYFPKIEKITPSVSSGPMIRLEAFLQKILKQGHIPPAAGILPPNFW